VRGPKRLLTNPVPGFPLDTTGPARSLRQPWRLARIKLTVSLGVEIDGYTALCKAAFSEGLLQKRNALLQAPGVGKEGTNDGESEWSGRSSSEP